MDPAEGNVIYMLLLKGEVMRILANSARPPSCERPMKFPSANFVRFLAKKNPVVDSGHKIQCAIVANAKVFVQLLSFNEQKEKP
jgi:hypothetical protein